MFSAMLNDAFNEEDPGVIIRFQTDGKLFNLRQLKGVTKVKERVIQDLLFADNFALNASTESDTQHNVNQFCRACDNFGITISTKMTEVLQQPGKPYIEQNILVNEVKLGSTLSRDVSIDDETDCRIAKACACATFGRL